MQLGEINSVASRPPGVSSRGIEGKRAAQASDSRALVTVTPAAASHEMLANYRHAPFIAQLIATKDQLPQTRERRRAEPGDAIAAYCAGKALA